MLAWKNGSSMKDIDPHSLIMPGKKVHQLGYLFSNSSPSRKIKKSKNKGSVILVC